MIFDFGWGKVKGAGSGDFAWGNPQKVTQKGTGFGWGKDGSGWGSVKGGKSKPVVVRKMGKKNGGY